MSFTIKQNDTSPSISATLKDGSGAALDLSGAYVRFHLKGVDGSLKVDAAVLLTDAANGVIQYNWASGDTDTAGTYYAEFEATYSDDSIETFPNDGNLAIKIVKELN
tara:strand:- start:187 stop:507 length:321 start_codon:yes stop_codon:yes gene_type:complete